MSQTKFPAAARLGAVELNVEDLDAMARFYQDALGLLLHGQDSQRVRLGAGREDLLVLVRDGAGPRAGRHASLYHLCLAVERRQDLGWWLRRLLDKGVELQGLVDHRMAEAIYLHDPEDNGIELNWDRPRSEWRPWAEWLAMGNAPLDVAGLLAAHEAAGPRPALAEDARVGHLHVHVGNLADCLAFYTTLGLDKTAEVPAQAVFTSAGGYHHHVAFNVWKGRGVPPQPLGALGLRQASFVLPSQADVDDAAARLQAAGYPAEPRPGGVFTRDPSGHGILVRAA